MRVLVTGGAGFIGSHIVDRLMEEDMGVVVLDNYRTGRLENLKHHGNNRNFQLVRGDVLDFHRAKSIVKNVDAVFNETAAVSVPSSIEDPIPDKRNKCWRNPKLA